MPRGFGTTLAANSSSTDMTSPIPRLSVILPVYNAMPYLPIAVRDMLKQRLPDDAPLELLVAFDGGADGSLDFLLALVAALGVCATDDLISPPNSTAAPTNPALLQPISRARPATSNGRPRKYAFVKVAGIILFVGTIVFLFSAGKGIAENNPDGAFANFYNEYWGLGFIMFANVLQAFFTLVLL